MIGIVTPTIRPISGANMPPALTTTSAAMDSREPSRSSTSTPVTRPRSTPMPVTRVCVRIVTPRLRAPAASAWASPDGSSQPSVGSQTAPRTPSVDISGNRSRASAAEISSIGRPNVWPQPAWRWSSSNRAGDEARRSDPTGCHDGSTPVSAARRPYSSAPYIIIFVRVTEPRSWPTRPAEWNVEPEVSSARSTRTMSVQPRSARWYAIDVPPTPPPMITARACWVTGPPSIVRTPRERSVRSGSPLARSAPQWQAA